MGFFSRNEGGIMDVIRCDEQDYLIWRWKPSGQKVNSTNKEISIRWGSSLRVKDGEVAIFVYRSKQGAMQDVIVGPYEDILKTDNLPILTDIIGTAYDGKSPFQAEVYFINTAGVIQIPFAIPYFSVYDPRFHDFACPVAARGRITFSISDYMQFIKLHRLTEFNLDQFSEQVTAGIKKYAKSFIGNAPTQFGFPVVQIERFIVELSDVMKEALAPEMLDDFGVTLKRVDLSSIDCDKESEEYQKLYKLTGRQRTKQVVFATDMGMIRQAAGDVDDLRHTRKSRKVGRIGELWQKLGLTKRIAGGEVGDDGTKFYIATDGKQKGPFAISTLIEMKNAEMISAKTYFWKEGMAEWKHANEIDELKDLFAPSIPTTPPTPPTD